MKKAIEKDALIALIVFWLDNHQPDHELYPYFCYVLDFKLKYDKELLEKYIFPLKKAAIDRMPRFDLGQKNEKVARHSI